MAKRKRFGEILVEARVLDEATLQRALERQKGTDRRLGQVLEEMGVIAEKDIANVLARQFGYKIVRDFARYAFSEDLLQLIDSEVALKKMVFPLKRQDRDLYLAVVNPLDMETFDNLSFRTGLRVIPCVTTPSEIQAAVTRHYLEQRQETAEPEPADDWWTILVVDDQELVRSAVMAALKRGGYNLLQAGNGAEGVKAAVQHGPHLIITDTVMPRMDGNEMFHTLQANPRTSDIPVIALSSKGAPEEEARLLDLGFYDFIAKPINPTRLLARVNRALRWVYGNHQE